MAVFLADFSVVIAIHRIEMISFIKLFSCHSVFPAAAHADEVSFLLDSVNSNEFITCFELICVDMCWGACLGRR